MDAKSERRRKKAISLLARGASVSDVAGMVGVSKQSIYNWMREAGLDDLIRPKGVPPENAISTPLAERVDRPSPETIRALRAKHKLSQKAASMMVSEAGNYRLWWQYERPVGDKYHLGIPLATWELFLLLTGEHPEYRMTRKTKQDRHGRR
jgi:transposase-like protein